MTWAPAAPWAVAAAAMAVVSLLSPAIAATAPTARLAAIVEQVTAAQSASPSDALAPRATLERLAALLGSDLTAADGECVRALAAYPNDPAVHNFAGVVDAQRGRFDTAEAHFLSAIRLSPRTTAPYTNLGRLYQEHAGATPNALAKALDVYRRLLAIEPSNGEGLYQAGLLLALNGAFAESRAHLDRLPQEARSRPQVLALLAIDRQAAGDHAGARAAVDALAIHPQLAEADVLVLLPAFAHLPDDALAQTMLEAVERRGLASASALQRLAAIHARHARYAEARALLERATQSRPTVPLLTDLARVAWKLQDPKGALGYLAHARTIDPRNAVVHFLFGMICVDQNLGREAYDSLRIAVELDPANPLINYAMGAVATYRRDPSEAIPYFEAYVRLRPDDPRGRFALGAARFYSNQLEAAGADLAIAVRSPTTAAGAHFFLGRIARQLDDLARARREIEQTLAAAPTYADAWAELGLIQTRAGQLTEAEASLTKALALDPQNYDATRNLAALYGRTRDPRRAEQEAKLATLIDAREARAQEFLRLVTVVP